MQERLDPDHEELHAYVDAELSPEARRRVEQRLAGDAQARHAVADYAAIGEAIRAAFDPVLREPVPAAMRRPPRRWRRPLRAFAAGLLLFATGLWSGAHLRHGDLLQAPGPPHVVREAASAYAVYTPEVRHPVEVPGDQEAHLVAWLSKRLGAPVQAPRLAQLGFQFLGGRLIASDDGAGALFMYEDAAGQRIVLYLCTNESDGRSTALRDASHAGISVFYWFDGPFSYALAGELGHDAMLALARAVYGQLVL